MFIYYHYSQHSIFEDSQFSRVRYTNAIQQQIRLWSHFYICCRKYSSSDFVVRAQQFFIMLSGKTSNTNSNPMLKDTEMLRIVLQNCREVHIDGLSKQVTNQQISQFLKDNNLEQQVTFVRLTDQRVQVSFGDKNRAVRFLKDIKIHRIGAKNINSYLNICLQKKFVKNYLLIGVKQSNLDQLYSVINQFAVPRLEFATTLAQEQEHYLITVSYALVNFLDQKTLSSLKQQLKDIGVSIKVIREKNQGANNSIKLINFLNQKPKYTREQVQLIVWRIVATLDVNSDNAPFVKIKSIQSNLELVKGQALKGDSIIAEIVGTNEAETHELYEQIKTQIKNYHHLGQALLSSKTGSSNSYSVLFTKKVYCPPSTNEQDFQAKLLEDYRLVSKNISKIFLLKTKDPQYYNVKIFFASELAGKQFLVHYTEYLQLRQHYNPQSRPHFQMYIDKQTLDEIRTRFGSKGQGPKIQTKKTIYNNLPRPVQSPSFPISVSPFPSFQWPHQHPLFVQDPNEFNRQSIQYIAWIQQHQQQLFHSYFQNQQPTATGDKSVQPSNSNNEAQSKAGKK